MSVVALEDLPDRCAVCGAALHTLRNANMRRTGQGLARRWMPPEGCVCSRCPDECTCRLCNPPMLVCKSCGEAPATLSADREETHRG